MILCASFNICFAFENAGWYVSMSGDILSLLSCWCVLFCLRSKVSRLTVSIRCICSIVFVRSYPLDVTHEQRLSSLSLRVSGSDTIRFIRTACPYGIDFFTAGGWQDLAWRYWCVSVSLQNTSVARTVPVF